MPSKYQHLGFWDLPDPCLNNWVMLYCQLRRRFNAQEASDIVKLTTTGIGKLTEGNSPILAQVFHEALLFEREFDQARCKLKAEGKSKSVILRLHGCKWLHDDKLSDEYQPGEWEKKMRRVLFGPPTYYKGRVEEALWNIHPLKYDEDEDDEDEPDWDDNTPPPTSESEGDEELGYNDEREARPATPKKRTTSVKETPTKNAVPAKSPTKAKTAEKSKVSKKTAPKKTAPPKTSSRATRSAKNGTLTSL